MAEASRVFDAPVISGNVSLYNETEGQGVYPTPVVGALGLLDDAARHCTTAFRDEGDAVLLLGARTVDLDSSALGGSEYLELVHGLVAGRPRTSTWKSSWPCSGRARRAVPRRPAQVGARLLRRRSGRGACRVLHRGRRGPFAGAGRSPEDGTRLSSANGSRESSYRWRPRP